MEWTGLADDVQAALAETERARDDAFERARRVVAAARRSIAAVHAGDATAAARGGSEARQALASLEAALADHPEIRWSGVLDAARQEVVESSLLAAYVAGANTPPAPAEIGVPAPAYALGLGDFVGELRRLALGSLARQDPDGARRHLEAMERAFAALQALDAPRAVADVKRVQDVARSLLDRTLGEVTIGVAAADLQRAAPTRTDTTRPIHPR